MKKLAPLVVLALCGAAYAQAPAARVQAIDAVQWKVSGSLPPGAEYNLVYEEPATRAIQLLVRFPSGYSLPSHTHTHDETIVVLKGKLIVDLGAKPETLGPGGYATIPAGLRHSLKAKGKCVMLVAVSGPYDVQGLPDVKR